MSRIRDEYENAPADTAEAEWAYKSRTYYAQITDVDKVNGTVRLIVEGTHDAKKANLPLGALYYNGINSSWQRHMPTPGSVVNVTYGPRNELKIVNYVAYGSDLTPAADGSNAAQIGGYGTLAKYAGDNTNSMQIFRTLDYGEFDLRSAGGAGYYFSKGGHATLNAGNISLDLDKNQGYLRGSAGLHRFGSDGTEVRFGDVKRLLPFTFSETGVVLPPPAPPTPSLIINPGAPTVPKEWSVTVAKVLVPGATPLTLYQEIAGDVRDGLGAPELMIATTTPLRYRKTLYGMDGVLPIFDVKVDALGNCAVVQSLTASLKGIDVSMATNPFTLSALSVGVTATATVNIQANATTDIGGIAGVNINAGGAADAHMMRAEDFATWLTSKLSVQTAFGPSGPAVAPWTALDNVQSLAAQVK